jgi:glycosyltransferase involved in cell wall biosynthesis
LKPQKAKISVIIPIYESQRTLARSLESIEAQTYSDYEVVVVDSSPSDACETIVRQNFSAVNYFRSSERLLPHAARNYGVSKCTSEILVFTDPDVYPDPDWLNTLAAADPGSGDLVVGSVDCYGSRWFDEGVHLAKFDIWLPGGGHRWIEIAPTVNLLCHRETFERAGGFPSEHMIGDTIFSWRVLEFGYRILFAPEASIPHHHLSNWGSLLKERWSRGAEFGRARVEQNAWGRWRAAMHLAISIIPIRWVKLMLRIGRNAARANSTGMFLLTLPVTMLSQAAWLLGESYAYTERIFT